MLKILDGRHRHFACTRIGVTPDYEDFLGDVEAAKAFVISQNLRRRDMTPSQKAACIAEVNEFRVGGTGANQYSKSKPAPVPVRTTQSVAAKANGVSERAKTGPTSGAP